MARSGIRYEDVQAAAETLLGRGLNPTIQRVREQLGTGSNTTSVGAASGNTTARTGSISADDGIHLVA